MPQQNQSRAAENAQALADHIARGVASAPPLTREMLDRLAVLLRAPADVAA